MRHLYGGYLCARGCASALHDFLATPTGILIVAAMYPAGIYTSILIARYCFRRPW
jgi:hypothetical protein